MLENFARELVNQDEIFLLRIGVGVYVAGFVFSLLVRTGSTWTLRRVPYFIISSAIFIVASGLPVAWLLTFEAMKNGLLAVLVASVYLGIAVIGFVYGVLSHARSVDACGNGRRAWMGVVPIVNLYLMVMPPMNRKKASLSGLTFNAAGLALGFILLFFGQILSNSVDAALADMPSLAQQESISDLTARTGSFIESMSTTAEQENVSDSSAWN